MRGIFSVLGVALAIAFNTVPTAHAQVLVLHFSDSQSEYFHLPNFLRTVSFLSQEFKRQNPQGTVLLVANGNIAGESAWTENDHGDLAYKALTELQDSAQVALTLGNREGLEIQDAHNPPHSVFMRQIEEWIQANPGQAVLVANLPLTSDGTRLMRPFRDYTLTDGQTWRVVGMTAHNFYPRSAYSFRAQKQLFLPWQPTLLDQGKQQLEQAARDGIQTMVFSCHESASTVETFARDLRAWQATQPHLSHIRLPYFGAANAQQVSDIRIPGSAIIESGAQYALSALTFDTQGTLQSAVHWPIAKQRALWAFPNLLPREQALLFEVEEQVSSINAINSEILSYDTPHTKTPLSPAERKEWLGGMIAQALAEWAYDSRYLAGAAPQHDRMVGMIHATAFNDAPQLFQGHPLTVGDIKKLIPNNNPISIKMVTGATLKKIQAALRSYGAQSQPPFETPMLDWMWKPGQKGFKSIYKHITLDPQEYYLLITDYGTGSNQLQIPALDAALRSVHWTPARTLPSLRQILETRFAEPLSICANLLRKMGK